MESSKPTIDSVPTEILLSILSLLPSRTLLPLLPVNRRFYSVALRILHTRLIKAAPLPDHRLILECYHPSAKISTPYFYGDYISTDDLEQVTSHTSESCTSLPRPTLSDLSHIYSHFRPVVQEENQRPRARFNARRGHAHRRNGSAQTQTQTYDLETPPTHDIYLDEDELFSQLCTITNLVKLGPKPGLFVSHINVGDVTIRVWRDWLAQQTTRSGATKEEKKSSDILWADESRTVGLRFRVAEKGMASLQARGQYQLPVLVAADEVPPVAYRLELEELVVRGDHLLMAMERSEAQEFEFATEGKAVMISA